MSRAFLMGLNSGRVEEESGEFELKDLAKIIDGSMKEFFVESVWGVSEVKPYCFYNSILEDVNLTHIRKIGNYAFFENSVMITIVFDNNLKTVGAYAFDNVRAVENVIMPKNIEEVGTYAFRYFAYSKQAFDLEFNKKCDVGHYGFQYAKVKSLKGLLGDLGTYAFASLGNGLEEIDVKIEGAIGDYAFAMNNTAMLKIDKDSEINSLGTYAFQNFGANRTTPASNIIVFDLRKSSFPSIGSYAFSGSSTAASNRPKYFDIFFPDTVTSIATYAFRYAQDFNVYFDSIPTLSNVNAFNGTSNYNILVNYLLAPEMRDETNWSNTNIVSNIKGYAQGDEFGIGDLPTHSKATGKPLVWYSDVGMTNVATEVEDIDDLFYASESGSRERWWLQLDITNTDVKVKNLNTNEIYTKSTFVELNHELKVIQADPLNDTELLVFKLNGIDIDVGDTFIMDQDYLLKVFSFDGEINFDFKTAEPIEMQIAANAGLANEYELGSTRSIKLKDGTDITLRIADNTGNIIKRDDDTYAGLVIEFVEQMPTAAKMNPTSTNAGGWDGSKMRDEIMADIYKLLPDDWKDVVADAKIQTMNGGSQSGTALVTSTDKLWLPAEREIFTTRSYSHLDEWNALERFALYDLPENDNNAFRIKRRAGSNQIWWLRSPYSSRTSSFVYVTSSGSVSYYYADSSLGVSPCFAI